MRYEGETPVKPAINDKEEEIIDVEQEESEEIDIDFVRESLVKNESVAKPESQILKIPMVKRIDPNRFDLDAGTYDDSQDEEIINQVKKCIMTSPVSITQTSMSALIRNFRSVNQFCPVPNLRSHCHEFEGFAC